MAIPLLEDDLNIIGAMGDFPGTDDGLTPDEFKQKFDAAALIIQEYLNTTLVPNINIAIDVDELANHLLEKVLNITGGIMKGDIDMDGNGISFLRTPKDPGDAATKQFVEDVTRFTYRTITLSASAWKNNQQSVTVSGVTNNIDLTVTPALPRSNVNAYSDAGILCINSDNNILTFQCEDKMTPNSNIAVNIKFRNLEGDA